MKIQIRNEQIETKLASYVGSPLFPNQVFPFRYFPMAYCSSLSFSPSLATPTSPPLPVPYCNISPAPQKKNILHVELPIENI